MTSGADPQPAYPQYAHQLQALLRRMAREDLEAIGAHLRRGGFGRHEAELRQGGAHGRVQIKSGTGADTLSPFPDVTSTHHRVTDASSAGGRTASVDFSRASPLSATPRQTGPVRIPHFDIQRISRTVVPRAKDGRTHPRYPDRSGIAAAHHGYVTRGGVADFGTHHDYITRITAVEESDTARLIDMLDMDEDRRLQNQLAITSNIPGGRERERSLFDAAERCERQAKGGALQVSTQHSDDWMLLANRQDAPAWVRKAALTLRQKRLAQAKKSEAKGEALVDVTIDIAKVNLEQAYERLRYVPVDPDKLPLLNPISPTYRFRVEGRFREWLTKHSRSYKHLRFVPGGYAIDKTVQPAIHRLFRLLGDDPEIQKLLLAERQRREAMAASAAVARDRRKQDHEGRSVLPSEGVGQPPIIVNRSAHAKQSRMLGDIDSLHDVEPLQALPINQEMCRRDAIAEPPNGEDKVSATSPVLPPKLAVSRAAPIRKSAGLIVQAVAAVGERRAVQARSGIPLKERKPESRGPADDTPDLTIKKVQER